MTKGRGRVTVVALAAGVALLPEPTLRREVRAGTLAFRPLEGCRFVRPLGIIHRRHHPLSAAASRFIELLRRPETTDRTGHTELGILAAGTPGKPNTNGVPRGRKGARRSGGTC